MATINVQQKLLVTPFCVCVGISCKNVNDFPMTVSLFASFTIVICAIGG